MFKTTWALKLNVITYYNKKNWNFNTFMVSIIKKKINKILFKQIKE
jgi:hypothetical protein